MNVSEFDNLLENCVISEVKSRSINTDDFDFEITFVEQCVEFGGYVFAVCGVMSGEYPTAKYSPIFDSNSFEFVQYKFVGDVVVDGMNINEIIAHTLDTLEYNHR